jgi:hypothetical protein
VKHAFSSYRGGGNATGLLLLRVAAALSLVDGEAQQFDTIVGWARLGLIAALLAGFSTRQASILFSVSLICCWGGQPGSIGLSSVALLGDTLAIACMGGGAWSVDAIRFGRQTIRLRASTTDT